MNVKNSQDNIQAPRVAVLLAAYNGAQWIEEQLTSILQQKSMKMVIFISVDQSTDGTLEICRKYSLEDSRIVMLPYGKYFGGAAKNFFHLIHDVDFSHFDYVSFADQDDIWLTDKLFHAFTILSATGVDAYSSNVMAFWPNGRKILIEKSQRQVRWDFLFEAAGPGCTYVLTKKLACAIQDMLKRHWNEVQDVGLHDWLVYAFARANGYRWVIDDYAGMLYRQHENNQVGVNSGFRAFAHRARKVLSGWGLEQSALIARLVGLAQAPFVMRWSDGGRVGLLWLALHAGQCRRRVRDKFVFALSCMVLCIAGNRRK